MAALRHLFAFLIPFAITITLTSTTTVSTSSEQISHTQWHRPTASGHSLVRMRRQSANRQSSLPCTERRENPVTYFGVTESIIRISKSERDWTYFDIGIDARTNSTLELGFRTFDQVSTLLFKGNIEGRTAFFALELFDGFVYLIYNLGLPQEDTVRMQISGGQVNDGEDHNFSFFIVRGNQDYVDMTVVFDDNVIEIFDQYKASSWDGYLYVGNVDSLTRHPWKTWTRRPFQGALTYLRLNGVYPDYSCFLGTHSHSGLLLGAKNITDMCANQSLCAQEYGGYCFVDRPSYLCDCAHMALNALDCKSNALVMRFSNLYYEVSFSPLWITHTDNLSISFNTAQSSASALIFRIQQESLKFYELRLSYGCLFYSVYVNRMPNTMGQVMNFTVACGLNDNKWHVFKMQRRGEQLRLYLDGTMSVNSTIPGYGFYMHTSLVIVGCTSAKARTQPQQCTSSSIFVGDLRNFIYNRVDILDLIQQGFQNALQVTTADGLTIAVTVTVTQEEFVKQPGVIVINEIESSGRPLPGNGITLTGSLVNIIELPRPDLGVVPLPDVKLFNISFWFRTQMTNAPLLFIHPNAATFGEYVAAELVSGQLRVAFLYAVFGSYWQARQTYTFSSRNVADNQFHFFSATFSLQTAVVMLDAQQYTFRHQLASAVSLSRDLFAAGYVLLGGMPNSVWQHAYQNGFVVNPPNYFFAGCIADTIVGQKTMDASALNRYYVRASRPYVAISQCNAVGPTCDDLMCQNFGVCSPDPVGAYSCNCVDTAYEGQRCTQEPIWGRYSARFGERPGLYSIDKFRNRCPLSGQVLSVGFKTNLPRGTLFRVQREDAPSDYLAAELREDGQLYLITNDREYRTAFQTGDDNLYHVLRVSRYSRGLRVLVDGLSVLAESIDIGTALPCDATYQVLVGGAGINVDGTIIRPFSGIVAGFSWNGINILELAENSGGEVTVVGDSVKHNLTMYPLRCPNIYNYHCAVIVPLIPGIGGEPPIGSVLAVAAVDSSYFLSRDAITALALIAGLLMFLSALFWALYMCKPGWCFCFGPREGYIGGGVKTSATDGTQTDMVVDSSDRNDQLPVNEEEVAVSSKPNFAAPVPSPTLTPQPAPAPPLADESNTYNSHSATQMNYGSMPRFEYHTDTSDFTLNRLDSTLQSNYQIERLGINGDAYSTGGTNAFNTLRQTSRAGPFIVPDEFKVNCFVITDDSASVLTGSAIGAPHRWDLQHGELIRAFENQEDLAICAHEIHLACDDTILVGQISATVTDPTVPQNMRRLQIWDVESGRPLEMPYIVYCTATCLINNKRHLCAGAVENGGKQVSVILWNLMANELARQIKYPLVESSGLSCADVQVHGLFAAPPDDRYLVVCLSRESSPLTSFVVLDIYNADQYDTYTQTVSITFDCHPDAIVLKLNYEAVIGTRQGEIIVWNIQTVKPSRQIWAAVGQEAHNQPIRSLAISHDLQYLASGSGKIRPNDETPQLCPAKTWRLDIEKLLFVVDGHNDDVNCCSFSIDNELLLTGSRDGSIRLWRMRDGSQMCWFTSNIEVLSLRMSNDKRAIVALGDKNRHRKLIMLQVIRNRTRKTKPVEQVMSSTIQRV